MCERRKDKRGEGVSRVIEDIEGKEEICYMCGGSGSIYSPPSSPDEIGFCTWSQSTLCLNCFGIGVVTKWKICDSNA